ncbi:MULTISPECIES: hypothetical protein [Pandoraea]|uniref:hypothetical protein n=1 Tax=Pandoraea TaxID=93217 RepID=UPI000B0032A4|nr:MULTISPECIES: hypothetical protein [Pandoraea]
MMNSRGRKEKYADFAQFIGPAASAADELGPVHPDIGQGLPAKNQGEQAPKP